MNQIASIAAIATLVGTAGASITDNVLYEQLSPTTLGSSASVYYSNPTHDQVMYDQFRFDEQTSIQGIGFWGAIYADANFTVSIYTESAETGLPGRLAYQHQSARDQADLSLSGSVVDDLWTTVEHHAVIGFDEAFSADSDTTYWLAITGDAFFSWTFGATSGDNAVLYSNTAQDSFWTNSDLGRDPTNLAFSVYGTAVPAPGAICTMMLLGAGISRRRRVC